MNEISPSSVVRTSRRFDLISATLAFIVWGGWAWYVNDRTALTEQSSAIVSGLTQGTASLLFTLIMVRSVTWIYHRLPHNAARLVLPAILTGIATGSCLLTAHVLVGTSNILSTIVPALTVAFCFNLYTTNVLRTEERNGERHTGGERT